MRIHPSPRLLPLVLVVLGLLAPGPRALRAETEGPVDAHVTTPTLGPPHDHPPVEADPDLTLAETIRLALERDPGLVGVEARQVEGRALERASRRWLAGAPALYGGAVSDSPVGSDIGYRQWDAGLELPLWWPGQRSPRRDVARAAKDAAAHAVRVQALEVAGQVRAAVAGLALARRRLELARGDREAEARLAERVERAVELGELAGREALLARTSVLERELAELEALEELRHAEASWVVLTGIERSPGEWGETLRSDARLEDHPALLLARDDQAQAEANAARLERSGWGHPTVSVGSQHGRDTRPEKYIHRVVAGLSVPIGRADPVSTGAIDARRAATDARRDAMRLERELRANLLHSEHRLDLAGQRLDATASQARLAADYLARTERGFVLGEVDLPTLVAARGRARAATLSHHEAVLMHRFLIAETNQALGVVP